MNDDHEVIPQSEPEPINSTPASPDFRAILASAPSMPEVLARPSAYEAWRKKAQEALNA